MDLNKFSMEILNKDIPLNTLKIILYMMSSEKDDILITDLCEDMYISKQKLVNEIKKFRPIDGFLNIVIEDDYYEFNILNDSFKLLDSKKKKKKEDKVSKKEDAVQIIFDYWVKIMGKSSRTKLDKKRKDAILKGLDNFTIEECKLAILGCSRNLWNMAKKDGNTKRYDSLELIFRSLDKTEGFIEDSNNPTIEEQLNQIESIPKYQKIEDRLNNNDWLEQRSNAVSDLINKNQDTKKSIEEKETLKIESSIKKGDIDIKGLVLESEKVFYSFMSVNNVLSENKNKKTFDNSTTIIENDELLKDTSFKNIKNDDIEDAKIIEVIEEVKESQDDIPYYLQFANRK